MQTYLKRADFYSCWVKEMAKKGRGKVFGARQYAERPGQCGNGLGLLDESISHSKMSQIRAEE